jgi:peroxiredoxin
MKDKFLESDFFSNRRVALFGINRIQSEPTVNHIKNIDKHHDQFIASGLDGVGCVSYCDFLLFDQLMPKLSKKIWAKQVDRPELQNLQKFLGKRGHYNFLQNNWQFACVINNGQLEFYQEQPFELRRISLDTRENIYSEVGPEKVLKHLAR